MIIIQLQGGLGNQLFQYALGRIISIKFGIDVRLDTNLYNDKSLRKFQLETFNIKIEQASINEINRLIPFYYRRGLISKVIQRYFKGLLITFYLHTKRIIKEKEHYRFDPDILNIGRAAYLIGYWQNLNYFKDITLKIKQEIQLRDDIASPYYGELQTAILSANSVSLHVRRGDFLNLPEYSNCTLNYYTKAMNYVTDRVQDTVFYVFSDDLPWARENITSKRPIYFVANCSCANEELLLMSCCRHHITANSTFSWWGAWLGMEEGIVVTPENWFTDRRKMYDFIPEKWIRISNT